MLMNKPKISIIAVIGKNRELGKNNKLLWRIPEDMKRFRELTMGHVVIMGRKTFESIGRPLPNRTNIIITHDSKFRFEEGIVCHSIEEALRQAQGKLTSQDEEIFVIGGGQVYEQAMPYASKLYLTLVGAEAKDADTFFPDYSEFKKVVSLQKGESGELKYTFFELMR